MFFQQFLDNISYYFFVLFNDVTWQGFTHLVLNLLNATSQVYNFLLKLALLIGVHLFSPEEMSLGFGAKVVFSLCKTIPDPACSVVYFDNFFTSLELIHMLRYNMGIFALGTIRSIRLRGAEQNLLPDKALKKKKAADLIHE